MRAGAICFAAAGLLAMSAAVQPPLGSRNDPVHGAGHAQPAGDQVNPRRGMRTFAACLLRNNSRVATDILLQPLSSGAQQAVIDRRVAGVHDCTGAGIGTGFNALTLAGALAEAGLQARFADADLGRITALTPDTITLLNLNPRNGYEDLGLCVVRRAPEAVRAWALSEPGSAAEAAARSAVLPQIGPCVDQGQPLRADLVGLRAILSAALYRAMHVTRR
jgi:hypothetical protein